MIHLRHLFAIILMCLTLGCVQAGNGVETTENGENERESQDALTKAWASGAVIVIAIDVTPDDTGETYSDFAHYLNQFHDDVQASTAPHWAFFSHPSRTADHDTLPLQIEIAVEPYSVLFFRKGHSESYLYQGPIVEPLVYELMEYRFSGRAMPPHLLPFSPERVTVRRVKGTGKFVVR